MPTLAVRHNNPGNVSLPIKGWKGGGFIVGAPGQSGYASFPNVQTGLAAFNARVTSYIGRGYNTIGSLNSIYAQDGNWKNNVSRLSGIGINTPLDASNPAQMTQLQDGILKAESGKGLLDWGGGPAANPTGVISGDPATQIGGKNNYLTYAPEQSGAPGLASGDPNQLGAGAVGPSGMVTDPQKADPNATIAPGTQSGILSGMWEMLGVTAVTTAGQAVSKATTTSGETIGKATTESAKTISEQQKASSVAETGTLAGIANAAFSNTFNLFQRFGVILLALLLIGLALWLMGSSTVDGAKRQLASAI